MMHGATEPMGSGGTPGQEAPLGGGGRILVRGLIREREALLEQIFTGERLGELAGRLLVVSSVLTGGYGFIMGLAGNSETMLLQGISSAAKLPLIYLLSLLICLPILYVVNVLMGSKLGLAQTATLILVALGLNSVMIACCAPITLFFHVTGASYSFMKLLHVGVLGFASLWALGALYGGLVSMCESSSIYPRQSLRILLLWIVVYGFVGTQMAWTLRPFIGSPNLEFEFVRRGGEGNFYQAVMQGFSGLAD